MKRSFKYICYILILVMTVGLTGCGNLATQDSGKVKIVCTTFPQYDWVREIAGEKLEDFELILLGNGGIDMHSYQPTTEDIVTIADCDIFIYGGGVSDGWVESTLEQATNEDMIVINMMIVLQDALREEEIVEGMEEDEHEEGEHHNDGEEAYSDDINVADYDEHVWLSLNNAALVCDAITEALATVDSGNKDVYNTNNQAYKDKLIALDSEYETAFSTAKYDTMVFGDRFPFIYLLKDYGVNYYAAFTGCSSESEASFETVAFLADKMDELELPVIIIVDGSTKDLANTILESANTSGQEILVLDSMQTMSNSDVEAGKTYLGTMEDNLLVFKQALGCE